MSALLMAKIPDGNMTCEARNFFHMTYANAPVTAALEPVHGALDDPDDHARMLKAPVIMSALPMTPPEIKLGMERRMRNPATPNAATSVPNGSVKQKSCLGTQNPVMCAQTLKLPALQSGALELDAAPARTARSRCARSRTSGTVTRHALERVEPRTLAARGLARARGVTREFTETAPIELDAIHRAHVSPALIYDV